MAVAEKVAFFRDAKHEVIEFGVTLSRFSNNLVSGSREEFRKYVESLLQRGVNFKCYLLNPSCNEARLYFGDRKTINLEEGRYERKIEDATFRLRAIQAEFVQAGYPGSFEVFTYEHVPYNYFMVVDMKSEHCKMVISHYMYGIKRSDSPVFEFTRKSNQELYNRYSRSIEALMRNAKRIIPHDHEFN